MKWQTKRQYYDSYFRVSYNVRDINFPMEIDTLLCKNEALRLKNRVMYHDHLLAIGAANVDVEMQQFDLVSQHLLLLDPRSMQRMVDEFKINILQSDIWIDDEDCIFKLADVPEDQVLFELDKTLTAIVQVNVLPQELIGYRQVWIDFSQCQQILSVPDLDRYRSRLAS
ncbi:hypothetical protein [Sphingobacterium griseoflavum]|uniref:Uncharacterized protein n=1 Tax=Sphingobacterium griseoflavum TaxID=1474952 RepID=A0ABQ3HVW2_9SPHI|nr:hypothetical protein [Sphingobacterium griseoflavum]GHE33127.1 hypothetical protein GCM10017764_15240 [Sphingobacterium griseoflavum]